MNCCGFRNWDRIRWDGANGRIVKGLAWRDPPYEDVVVVFGRWIKLLLLDNATNGEGKLTSIVEVEPSHTVGLSSKLRISVTVSSEKASVPSALSRRMVKSPGGIAILDFDALFRAASWRSSKDVVQSTGTAILLPLKSTTSTLPDERMLLPVLDIDLRSNAFGERMGVARERTRVDVRSSLFSDNVFKGKTK